ncbi:MAG: SRPBCC domain-containing protein [Steroidobacteraceae bacterium]
MKKARPDSSNSPVFECDFEEPPEKVWRALTEPELLQAWLEQNVEPARTDYEILNAEPHRTLRYRWRDPYRAGPAGCHRLA